MTKTIRYVKQRDETSCGPIAIINIFKWLGYSATYKSIKDVKALCNWKDGRSLNGGTGDLDFEKALKVIEIKKKRKVCPTLRDIDKHIDSGGIVVISYYHPFSIPNFAKKDGGHFTLCVSRNKKSYTLVNDSNKTIIKRSRKIVKRMLNHKVDGYKSWAWFVSK